MASAYREKMFENVDFGSGRVSPLRSYFDPAESLEEQVDVLREDMYQVSFNSGFVIDVGWYPTGNLDGGFIIHLILDEEWDNPVQRCECKSYEDAETDVTRLLKLVQDADSEP